MNRGPILLILTTERKSMAGVQKAMDKASKKDEELLVLFILDEKLSEATITTMTESGWLGGKASDELHEAIQREYLIQGNELIDNIKELCGNKGVRCRGILRGGDFLEETLKVLHEEKVDEVVAIRRRRSHFSRYFFGSVVVELCKRANREIEIVDED